MDSVLCRQSVVKINLCNLCNSWFFIVDFVELKLPPASEACRRTHVK